MAMRRQIPGIVVHHPIRPGDFLTTDLAYLVAGCGTMQAGSDQDRDVLARNARLLEPAQDRRKSLAIGRRPCDIANRNSRAAFTTSHFQEWWSINRPVERRFQSPLPIR